MANCPRGGARQKARLGLNAMNAYLYRGCRVSIHELQFDEGLWKGDATVMTGTLEQRFVITVGASSEGMALTMAARQCNRWIDERLGGT